MKSKDNKLTDEQLNSVVGGKGYAKDEEKIIIIGLNVAITKSELYALAEKDPSQLSSYEQAILDYARNANLI